MSTASERKPYQALGIGDVVALGRVTGHTFVFEALRPVVPAGHFDQQWLSRGRVQVDHTDLCVTDGVANLGVCMRAGSGYVTASLRLTAKECADLATQLLSAAMLLEAGRAAQQQGVAA